MQTIAENVFNFVFPQCIFSNSVALSVSEEKNRALKVTQEKNNLLHQLHRTEAELVSAKAEIKRANDEITAQREKVKTFHANKIAADKKVAEFSTINSKLEVCFLFLLFCCVLRLSSDLFVVFSFFYCETDVAGRSKAESRCDRFGAGEDQAHGP